MNWTKTVQLLQVLRAKRLSTFNFDTRSYAKGKCRLFLGDHVTTDAGTGAVHTAPAHGAEDFAVGKLYDLPVNNPVGATGTYLDSTEIFAGQFVFKANAEVVKEA